MNNSEPIKTRSKYSLNQRLWQATIAVTIVFFIYFVAAKFYYDHSADKQDSINQYFKTEINKVDLKIKELKDLSQFRHEYVNLMHIQSEFQSIGERNNQYLSELFKALPFEWSVKQMDISTKQITIMSTGLTDGIYLLSLRSNNRTETFRIQFYSSK